VEFLRPTFHEALLVTRRIVLILRIEAGRAFPFMYFSLSFKAHDMPLETGSVPPDRSIPLDSLRAGLLTGASPLDDGRQDSANIFSSACGTPFPLSARGPRES